MAPWPAVFAQALLFTVFGTGLWVITAGWGVLAERGAIFFGMGILLGVLRVTSGSLWTCVGFHLGFQVIAQTMLGQNVSAQGNIVLVGILPSFLLAAGIVSKVMPRTVDWKRLEPDSANFGGI